VEGTKKYDAMPGMELTPQDNGPTAFCYEHIVPTCSTLDRMTRLPELLSASEK